MNKNKQERKMTNFEKIKNMSVEEMAEMFSKTICGKGYCMIYDFCRTISLSEGCVDTCKEWLESEVTENA